MPALQRINAPDALADYLDSADEIYGSGVDGSTTLTGSGNSMTSDMYYYNLTLADNAVLDTGGYRLFVKNVLTIGTGVVIGRAGGASTAGTLKGGAAAAAPTTNSLGGNGAAGNAVPPTAAQGGTAYYQYAAQAVKGYNITASMTQPEYLQGGSGGASGEGAGGGVVIVAARYVACSGASQIAATGGANAGGGVIIFISTDSLLNSNITLNVSGQGTGTAGTAHYIEVD